MESSPAPEPVVVPPEDEQPTPHHKPRRDNIFWAIGLIVIGGVLLMRNLLNINGVFNWWAIFILIPAAGSLSASFSTTRRHGFFNATARSSLGSGLVLLTLALIFLFNLDWEIWWPLMVIVPGISMILSGFPDDSLQKYGVMRGFLSLGLWLGLAAVVLGTGFLLKNLGWIDPESLLPAGWRWWGAVILLSGLGALLNGIFLRNTGTMGRKVSSYGLMLIGLLACVVGGLALFGLNWQLLTPLAIIAIGLGLLFSLIGKK
jgi:hypothetical protein